MKLTYYIWSIPYNSSSGGSVALHRLAHDMTVLGHDVVLVADTKNPFWEGFRMNHNEIVPDPKGVAVYPEIVNGNPFGMPVVVRWLLNNPGTMGGDGIYEDMDLVYKYVPAYKAPDESKVRGLLATWTLDDTLAFIDEGKHTPGKTCYLVRKGLRKPLNKHPKDALCIDDYGSKGGHAYLRAIFNEYETFICYDHHCHIPNLSALAGCNTIIIPNGEETPEEFIRGDAFLGYGKAYGFCDIPRAIETQPLLRDKIIEVGNRTNDQISQLIKDTEEAWR